MPENQFILEVNHFGSPFNFPEEFTTVYRLHPLVPDLAEYREWDDDPNKIRKKVSFVETFRDGATEAMTEGGLPDWTLSMGRQRLGLLTLNNHAQFLQNLKMERLARAGDQRFRPVGPRPGRVLLAGLDPAAGSRERRRFSGRRRLTGERAGEQGTVAERPQRREAERVAMPCSRRPRMSAPVTMRRVDFVQNTMTSRSTM